MLGVDEKCRPCSLHGNEACYREEQYCFTRMTVEYVMEYANEMLEEIELQPAVFLDRDGVINKDSSVTNMKNAFIEIYQNRHNIIERRRNYHATFV